MAPLEISITPFALLDRDSTIILTNIISTFNTISLVNVYKVHLDVGEDHMQVSLTPEPMNSVTCPLQIRYPLVFTHPKGKTKVSLQDPKQNNKSTFTCTPA